MVWLAGPHWPFFFVAFARQLIFWAGCAAVAGITQTQSNVPDAGLNTAGFGMGVPLLHRLPTGGSNGAVKNDCPNALPQTLGATVPVWAEAVAESVVANAASAAERHARRRLDIGWVAINKCFIFTIPSSGLRTKTRTITDTTSCFAR